ncbi:uncharacterized protein [Apostichopus japonicus]|uniref:uncharacterized protein isoform X3 n=1 Tax=Stichopus japonicus TaxID=307972 RepID=UPI003AB79411
MPSFAMTTSTAKSFGGNQMPGTSTSSSVISVNSADKYMSDYIDIMEPEDDSYASDEDLKAIIEESLRDLDNTRLLTPQLPNLGVFERKEGRL